MHGMEPAPNQPPLPPWRAYPDTGPYEIHWRMGAGESFIGEFWESLSRLSDDARWDYFRAHLPIPNAWLPIVAEALTGSEDNEQLASLEYENCDRVLDDPTSFPGVRQLAASGLCDFAEFATWLRAETLYHDQISSFEPTLYDSVLEVLHAWNGPISHVSFTYNHDVSLTVECHSESDALHHFTPLAVTLPGHPFRDAFLSFMGDTEVILTHYIELARRLHQEKILESLFEKPVQIVFYSHGSTTPNEILTGFANPKSPQNP